MTLFLFVWNYTKSLLLSQIFTSYLLVIWKQSAGISNALHTNSKFNHSPISLQQYIEKIQAFFNRVYHEIIQQAIQTILGLTKSSKRKLHIFYIKSLYFMQFILLIFADFSDDSMKQDSDTLSFLAVPQSSALMQFKPVSFVTFSSPYRET